MARSSFIYSSFQGITKIADLTACSNLTVLYLYNNKLKSIEALDSAPHIQLLYLQNNKIARMGGLEKLKKLKKLYLTRNKIQVLEGLLENRCLEVFWHQNGEWSVSALFVPGAPCWSAAAAARGTFCDGPPQLPGTSLVSQGPQHLRVKCLWPLRAGAHGWPCQPLRSLQSPEQPRGCSGGRVQHGDAPQPRAQRQRQAQQGDHVQNQADSTRPGAAATRWWEKAWQENCLLVYIFSRSSNWSEQSHPGAADQRQEGEQDQGAG